MQLASLLFTRFSVNGTSLSNADNVSCYFVIRLDSLDKTLDYSHHNAPPPPGATVGDEADNGRAKASNSFHYIQILVYCSSNTGESLSMQECFCALGFIRGASIACHKQEPSNKGKLIFTDMFSVWYTVEPPIRDPPR